MIYIQIAAYKDPELVPTITDCLAKAKYPDDLRFGICWQTEGEDRSLEAFQGDRRFRIDRVPWAESQGLCWARARLQKLWEGEEFTLQLDSHHRFTPGWDAELLAMLEQTGSAKPILTSYAGMYDAKTGRIINEEPYKMVAQKFTESGTILFRPHHIPGWRELEKPIPARFVSGHFFFTLGRHCEEYRYDPQLYFAGDEISLSIRSYTLGYDLFHPHRTVLWHEYTREGRVKHWTDHTTENKPLVGRSWHERDALSKKRLRKMLREEDNDADLTGYDLGTVRSHADYERYAGIDFAGRRLQQATLRGDDPPCRFGNAEQWEAGFGRDYQLQLQWKLEDLEPCEDCHFVYFGVEDGAGKVLHRFDAPPESPEAQRQTNRRAVQFHAESQPEKLVVWPVSKSRGWLKRVDYAL
jgi:hypothetical protein